MAIPTFVAGNVLTAAQLNTISTALTITDAWTTYTPTLTQSATVTKTVTYARYIKVGRMVTVAMKLDITGTGTAANAIVVGLPAFAPVITSSDPVFGSGWIFDASGSNAYPFLVAPASTTTFRLLQLVTAATAGYLGNSTSFAAAITSPDSIQCTFTYEATT